jgi:predicted short-subunit dehydrogenase-like oxidoreductase (DUF2520 family)
VVTLLGIIKQLSSGMLKEAPWQKVFRPLIETSIDNALQSDPRNALTGPVRRGDEATIRLHREALQKFHPEFLPLYKELTRQAKGMVRTSRNSKKKR